MTQAEVIRFILESPKEKIFPDGQDPNRVFRNFSKYCHPDVVRDKRIAERAKKAFERLKNFHESFNKKTTEFKPMFIGGWVLEKPLAKGDIADIYDCSSKTVDSAVFKIVRHPRDNDLLQVEFAALEKLNGKQPHEQFKEYIPQAHATLMASGRRANVLSKSAGFHSLTDIMTIFPDGLEFAHVIWMGNRLLSALGYVHRNGIVHGAVLPSHVLYHPKTHAMKLVGWGQSVTSGKLRVLPSGDRYMYPKEVGLRRNVTPALDLFMAGSILRMAALHVPKRFESFFDWCRAESPSARPQDAWKLQDRWRALAKEEFGKSTYRELKLPVV